MRKISPEPGAGILPVEARAVAEVDEVHIAGVVFAKRNDVVESGAAAGGRIGQVGRIGRIEDERLPQSTEISVFVPLLPL